MFFSNPQYWMAETGLRVTGMQVAAVGFDLQFPCPSIKQEELKIFPGEWSVDNDQQIILLLQIHRQVALLLYRYLDRYLL